MNYKYFLTQQNKSCKAMATHLFCRGSITKSELLEVTPQALEKFENPQYKIQFKKAVKEYGKREAERKIMYGEIDFPDY